MEYANVPTTNNMMEVYQYRALNRCDKRNIKQWMEFSMKYY